MNILIAEDNKASRLMLSETVKNWGHHVTAVADGVEALRVLQSDDRPPVAILDWMMPKLEGVEVCRQLRAAKPAHSTYLMLLTSRDQNEDIIQGLDSGADEYLTKPFNPPQLRARLVAVERCINERITLKKQVNELQEKIDWCEKIEAALRESQQYRDLFKHANDSIIVFDPEKLVVLNVNDKACETYGIPRESFLGIPLHFLSPNRARHEQLIEVLRSNRRCEEFEMIHLRADNKSMNMVISASLVEYEGREAILSINRDITDRRLIEQQMLRAVKEWSGTVDAISDMIFLTDANGAIRRCNRAATIFFGESFRQLIGKNLHSKLFSPYATETEVSLTTNPQPLSEPIWEGKLEGREGWFEISNHFVAAPKGTGDRVHIIKNITGRKQSEALLRRLNTAIEQAADSIVITDSSGVIKYVNPAFAQVTGWERSSAIDQKLIDLHAGELETMLPTGGIFPKILDRVWHGTFKAQKRNGEIFEEEMTISPVKDEQGEILDYVSVSRDVTEKKRLESIAEAVNMMQNVGYIFSGIRHELGNPINSIKMALSVLFNNVSHWNTERVVVYIERCLTELGRVEYLLQSLKTFSLFENPKLQSVSLADLMVSFLPVVEDDFLERGIKISFNAEKSVKNCYADPRALHQVLLNLLSNAADALEYTSKPAITIRLNQTRRRVELQIEDNGCGMTDEQQQNLFKPFYTSKVEGTGLGLVIIKKLISKMRATIDITSRLRSGTLVTLSFEIAENE